MKIECPKCNEYYIVDIDFLPFKACDDMDVFCDDCGHGFAIGWVATIEIRDDNL